MGLSSSPSPSIVIFMPSVATSRSKAEAVKKVGWALNTYSYKRLDAYGLDQSHFLGQGWRRSQRKPTRER